MPRLRRVLVPWIAFASLLVAALLGPASAAADPLSAWTPGPGAILDDTYDGFIDVPQANASVPSGGFTVAGWFVDTTAQGWAGTDDVEVWQGAMESGGRMLAKAIIGQSRPDVAAAEGNPYFAAAGFAASVPGGVLTPGAQSLLVYAHTPGKGWWYKQVNVNVSASASATTSSAPAAAPAAPAPAASGTPPNGGYPIVGIEKPKADEVVSTCCDYEIIGWALDPSASPSQGVGGSGIDTVVVYLGDRANGGTLLGNAQLGYSDPTPIAQYGGQFDGSGWRLTFKPTNFHINTYLIYAYAHSVVTGKTDNAVRFFAIHD